MPRPKRQITFAPEALLQIEGMPVTLLVEPEPQDGDYLAAEHAWGELPEILPLPDLARFLAHELGQNADAILRALEGAIANNEVEFFGLLASGTWQPGMLRVTLHDGHLHLEAMGMEPGEGLRLWQSKGGDIPENLKRLVRVATKPTKPTPARGISKQEILAHPWPVPASIRLPTLLSDVPKWLHPARVARGAPGKTSSLWNPAMLAACLASAKGVSIHALGKHITEHYPEWLDEWQEIEEKLRQ